jgi:arylsulfatase A-like enzyme
LQAILDAYDASIMETDAEFGKLIHFLRNNHIYDETVIIVMGDHGEIFNEHSRGQFFPFLRLLDISQKLPLARRLVRRFRLLNAFGWLGHLDIPPYEEVVRVPLIVKFPNNRWEGRREDAAVELIDLPPTLLALVDQECDAAGMQGVNLLPLLEETIDNCHEFNFSDSQTHDSHLRYVSVQQGEWKLIRAIRPRFESIFDYRAALRAYLQRWLTRSEILVNTQDEHRDRKREERMIYRHLQHTLDAWLVNNERLATADSSTVEDRELRDQLAKLGYLSR